MEALSDPAGARTRRRAPTPPQSGASSQTFVASSLIERPNSTTSAPEPPSACHHHRPHGRCRSPARARRTSEMTYVPADDRYDRMLYRRSGRSGLELPAISLGLWQNFGDGRPLETSRAIVRRAFDLGVTHFDLANNYGPPYGSAEVNFGRLLAEDLRPFRDELVISTKAGYD